MSSRLGLGILLLGIVGLCGSLGVLNARPAPVVPDEPKPSTQADEKAPTFKADVMPILKDVMRGMPRCGQEKGRRGFEHLRRVDEDRESQRRRQEQAHQVGDGPGAKLMPPKNALPEAQVAILKAWIAAARRTIENA